MATNDATPDTATLKPTPIESLVAAYITEQRQARYWRIAFRIVFLLLAVIAFFIWASHTIVNKENSSEHTAVIEIRGAIGSGEAGDAARVLPALKEAFENKQAKGIVLLIDSPGGSPVHAGIINDEIRRLKAQYKKPIYTVVEDSCASAAYYIAVSTDKIFVDKASIVGSIGVLMDGFGFTGLMDKVGVERRLLTAGQNKGFLDPFSPQTPNQKAYAQQLLDEIHMQFIDVVKKGRGSRLKETPETFSGLFWSGDDAVRLGLADAKGNLPYVAREVIHAEELVDYTEQDNLLDRLTQQLGASIGSGIAHSLKTQQSIPALR